MEIMSNNLNLNDNESKIKNFKNQNGLIIINKFGINFLNEFINQNKWANNDFKIFPLFTNKNDLNYFNDHFIKNPIDNPFNLITLFLDEINFENDNQILNIKEIKKINFEVFSNLIALINEKIINCINSSFVFNLKTITIIVDYSNIENILIHLCICKIAKQYNVLIISIIITPFLLQGKIINDYSIIAKKWLNDNSYSFIEISSNNLINLHPNIYLEDVNKMINQIINKTLFFINSLLNSKSIQNIPFNEFKKIINSGKPLYLNFASAIGKNKVEKLLNGLKLQKFNSLELDKANKVIFKLITNSNLEITKLNEIVDDFKNLLNKKQNPLLLIDYQSNNNLYNEIQVFVLAQIDDENDIKFNEKNKLNIENDLNQKNYNVLNKEQKDVLIDSANIINQQQNLIEQIKTINKTLEISIPVANEKTLNQNTNLFDETTYTSDEILTIDDDEYDDVPSFLK